MKKRIILTVLFVVMAAACLVLLTACGEDEQPHSHEYGDWQSDAAQHWKECSCGEKSEIANHDTVADDDDCTTAVVCSCGYVLTPANASHSGGTATCMLKAVCENCGKQYGGVNPANHSSNEFTYLDNNDGTHTKKNKCCGAVVFASEAHVYTEEAPCACGAIKGHTHAYTMQSATAQHIASAATCLAKATYYYSCSCGANGTATFESGEKNMNNHTLDTFTYTDNNDGTTHAKKHKCCGTVVIANEAHVNTETTPCVCGAIKGHTHAFTLQSATEQHIASAATCLAKAKYYYSCSCGANGTATFESGEKNANNHSLNTFTYTDNGNGTHTKKHECCNAVVIANEAHVYTEATPCVCGAIKPHVHSYASAWKYDNNNHWHECACGDKSANAAHVWGEGVVTTPAALGVAGVRTFTCECGKQKTEVIPALTLNVAGRTYSVANAETDLVYEWASQEEKEYFMLSMPMAAYEEGSATTKVAFDHKGRVIINLHNESEVKEYYTIGADNLISFYSDSAHTTKLTKMNASLYGYDYQFNSTKEKLTVAVILPGCEASKIIITLTAGPELLENCAEYEADMGDLEFNWDQQELVALGEEYGTNLEDIEYGITHDEIYGSGFNFITVQDDGTWMGNYGYYEILEDGTVICYKTQADFESKTARTDVTVSVNADRTQISITRPIIDGYKSTFFLILYLLED